MVSVMNILCLPRVVWKVFVHHFFPKKIFENIFAFFPLTVKNFEFTSSFVFFSRYQNFFRNRKIPTTADVACVNVCVHPTFTILNLLSMSFLTPLQSKFKNFEVTSSLAFFLKISELFSKPDNSNYSRHGDRKRMAVWRHNKTNKKFLGSKYLSFPK